MCVSTIPGMKNSLGKEKKIVIVQNVTKFSTVSISASAYHLLQHLHPYSFYGMNNNFYTDLHIANWEKNNVRAWLIQLSLIFTQTKYQQIKPNWLHNN